MSDAERPPSNQRRDRCILWLPGAGRADRELLGALERRQLTVILCDSPFAAIGALCAGRREQGALVLIMVDPATLSRVDEVVAASGRYAARAVLWVFDSVSRRLRASGDQEFAARPAAVEVVIPARAKTMVAATRIAPSAPPALKLAGEGPLPPLREAEEMPGALSAGISGAQPVRQVLTDEELAMLLSPGTIRGNG